MMFAEPPARAPRRLVLKTLLALLSAPALWLMNALTRRAEALPENANRTLTVPLPAANEIRFYDQAIVVSGKDGISVYSSACPHLGCRIKQAEGSALVCPCHGSRFNSHGKVLRGPAERGLRPLPFEVDRSGAVLRIALKQ
jgi:Rieske Fe-S protein